MMTQSFDEHHRNLALFLADFLVAMSSLYKDETGEELREFFGRPRELTFFGRPRELTSRDRWGVCIALENFQEVNGIFGDDAHTMAVVLDETFVELYETSRDPFMRLGHGCSFFAYRLDYKVRRRECLKLAQHINEKYWY